LSATQKQRQIARGVQDESRNEAQADRISAAAARAAGERLRQQLATFIADVDRAARTIGRAAGGRAAALASCIERW
jgi:hypothetical protein